MLHELRILLSYLRRYARAYVAGSVAVVVSIGLKLFIPDFLGRAIDALRKLFDAQAPAAAGASSVLARSALAIFLLSVVVAFVRTASRLWILGTSRRVALPLLQHLDRRRLTRRLPDDRRTLLA